MTEPVGNADPALPTVKMMGTASLTAAGDISVAFPAEPVKGRLLKRGGCVLPQALNPGTAGIRTLHRMVMLLGWLDGGSMSLRLP